MLQGDVGDVAAPHLIRFVRDKLPNEVGVGGLVVAGVRSAGSVVAPRYADVELVLAYVAP